VQLERETDDAWQMMLLALPTQLAQEQEPNTGDSLQHNRLSAISGALKRTLGREADAIRTV
jgi:hypothetical protein